MVYGLDKFKEYFGDYTNQYVFIGGTACDIIFDELGADFRATKDLDIVLIIDALDASFGEAFWQFIEDGGYEHRGKSAEKNQFYRFTGPRKANYPKMIELFCRKPVDFALKYENRITPIHIDDSIMSLSAILLNDVYYESIIRKRRRVDGYSVVEIETLILLKIKAWLDLSQRKADGDHIDSNNIKKHKNDIFRLLANVLPSSRMEIAEEIERDIRKFVEMIKEDKPDLKNLGLKNTDFNDLMGVMENVFLNKQHSA